MSSTGGSGLFVNLIAMITTLMWSETIFLAFVVEWGKTGVT